MATFSKSISVMTEKIHDFVNITGYVQSCISESKIKEGVAFVNTMHVTSCILLQEDDPSVHNDLTRTLEKIVPVDEDYEHNNEGNDNAAAHIKTNLLGSGIAIPIKGGKLLLGRWQQIFLAEMLEPREREVAITIMGEK